jgi:hypothetical protein
MKILEAQDLATRQAAKKYFRANLGLAVITLFICTGWNSISFSTKTSTLWLVSHIDWQVLSTLPVQFRNHCYCDARGRYYCSNHCGVDYAFYYCSRKSFGCCHVGKGYCDRSGLLRCRPALFP